MNMLLCISVLLLLLILAPVAPTGLQPESVSRRAFLHPQEKILMSFQAGSHPLDSH